MHQQHMRSSRNIRVDSNWEDKLIILAVEVIKMVAPDILHVPRVNKAVAVRRVLNEHHRREIINIPVRRDFNKPCLGSMLKRLHPSLSLLLVIDLSPAVACPEVVSLTVLVAHAVVVLDAIVEEKLGSFFASFPPILISLAPLINLQFKTVVPGCDASSGRLPSEFSQHPIRFVEHLTLLLYRHVCRVFMGIAV